MNITKQIEQPTKPGETLPRGSETILIVDDEKDLADFADSVLSDLGYTTICAHSGEEAIRVLEDKDSIDLVFTDVVMPGSINGFDLADSATNRHPQVKILLTSGFTGKMKHNDTSAKWSKALIMKPYQSIELANRVRTVLDDKG